MRVLWESPPKTLLSINEFFVLEFKGTGACTFPNLFRELNSFYSLDFVAILETRCSGSKATSICSKLGFSHTVIVDADGYRGGIWCLWSNKFRSVEVSCTNP